MRLRAMIEVARGGDLRGRLQASVRDGQAAVRVAQIASALDTGVLDALRHPRTTAHLAELLGVTDTALLDAYLRTLAAAGWVRSTDGVHALRPRGTAVLEDDVVRAAYEGFGGYHTDLYRDLPRLLQGGPGRDDVVTRGDVIARLSRAMAPFLHETLLRAVGAAAAARVLDVGCGDGGNLVAMLHAAPEAQGVGLEQDAAAAALARRSLERAGLDGRARIVQADARDVLRDAAALGGPFDVVLLANVVYYLPVVERTTVLRDVAAGLAPGGRLVVVTSVAEPSPFSRHFDLLLRAQDGAMELPTVRDLTGHLHDAGLTVASVRRISPGEPLHAVVAHR